MPRLRRLLTEPALWIAVFFAAFYARENLVLYSYSWFDSYQGFPFAFSIDTDVGSHFSWALCVLDILLGIAGTTSILRAAVRRASVLRPLFLVALMLLLARLNSPEFQYGGFPIGYRSRSSWISGQDGASSRRAAWILAQNLESA